MYAKLFESMYDGTLSECWEALVTFQQLCILSDQEGFVDMTPSAISRRTNIPIEIIMEGIRVLEGPDPESRTSVDDGRRIVRLDSHRSWGWQVVNKQKYAELRNAEDRREYQREWVRQKRTSQSLSTDAVDTSRHESTKVDSRQMSTHIDVDTDTDVNTEAAARATKVDSVEYHVRCVVALNAGLRANPHLVNRWREVSASEQQGTVTWEADGIPIAVAEAVIADRAQHYRPTPRRPQPQSLKYFDAAVREAFELSGLPPPNGPIVGIFDPWAAAAKQLEAKYGN